MRINKMLQEDKSDVIAMMRVFYASEAVLSNGSEEIFEHDVDACIDDNPYLEGFVFKDENEVAGYAMLAKSFSTEFGKPCVWIEDLYVKPLYRSKGIGRMFFETLFSFYHDVVFRLEVEKENEHAVALYEKSGFEVIPYVEMIRKHNIVY